LHPIVWRWGFEFLAFTKGESGAVLAVHGDGIDLRQLLYQMPFDGIQFN
jgi:hypothetical protein